MFSVRLPANTDLVQLKTRLYDEFRIEVPTILWNDQKLIRISIQAYNSCSDAQALVEALAALLEL
jgi:selenocysteine lyase/cysteine desulfurase